MGPREPSAEQCAVPWCAVLRTSIGGDQASHKGRAPENSARMQAPLTRCDPPRALPTGDSRTHLLKGWGMGSAPAAHVCAHLPLQQAVGAVPHEQAKKPGPEEVRHFTPGPTARATSKPVSHAPEPPPPWTHSSTQCAAVTIHSGVMMEPPQTWVPWTCRLTCQGQSPRAALLPPTIRLWRIIFPVTPHSESESTVPVGRSGAAPRPPQRAPSRLQPVSCQAGGPL